MGAGEAPLKAQDVFDVGAPEFVNGLIVVAHHAEIPVSGGHHPQKLELHRVGVLILVHHDIVETLLIPCQHLGKFPEELHGPKQKVVEIQSVVFLQLFFVFLIEPGDVPFPEVRRLPGIKFCVLHLIFRSGDLRQHSPLPVHLGVQIQGLDHLLHEGPLIVPVVNGKIPLISETVDVPAQDPHAHGMEGGDKNVLAAASQHGVHPLPHLSRRLVGKGNGQDLPGHHALFDEPGDPVGQHPGLSGTGSRQNQKRALLVENRLPLPVIQFCKRRIHFHKGTSFLPASAGRIATVYQKMKKLAT